MFKCRRISFIGGYRILRRGISKSSINTNMDEDELFWDDNYNLISHIAMAIRQDLEKLEMRKGWMGFWDES